MFFMLEKVTLYFFLFFYYIKRKFFNICYSNFFILDLIILKLNQVISFTTSFIHFYKIKMNKRSGKGDKI